MGQESLVERVRAGDAAAWSELYAAHCAPVRRFARRLLGDAQAAEDLVQEVFAALPAALRGFRGEAQLSTFVLSIASRRAKNHVRGAIRRRKALTRLAEHHPAQGFGEDPERAVQERELVHALAAALDRLPLALRVTFVLCEIEERSSEEASAILGVPAGTVRTRLHHARKKLQATFERGVP